MLDAALVDVIDAAVVLLAEDDDSVRAVAKLGPEASGYTVLEAARPAFEKAWPENQPDAE